MMPESGSMVRSSGLMAEQLYKHFAVFLQNLSIFFSGIMTGKCEGFLYSHLLTLELIGASCIEIHLKQFIRISLWGILQYYSRLGLRKD